MTNTIQDNQKRHKTIDDIDMIRTYNSGYMPVQAESVDVRKNCAGYIADVTLRVWGIEINCKGHGDDEITAVIDAVKDNVEARLSPMPGRSDDNPGICINSGTGISRAGKVFDNRYYTDLLNSVMKHTTRDQQAEARRLAEQHDMRMSFYQL